MVIEYGSIASLNNMFNEILDSPDCLPSLHFIHYHDLLRLHNHLSLKKSLYLYLYLYRRLKCWFEEECRYWSGTRPRPAPRMTNQDQNCMRIDWACIFNNFTVGIYMYFFDSKLVRLCDIRDSGLVGSEYSYVWCLLQVVTPGVYSYSYSLKQTW